MKSTLHLFYLPILIVGTAVCQTTTAPGKAGFDSTCSICHGGDARGGEMGPNITTRVPNLSDVQLSTLLHDGLPGKGMPGFPGMAEQEKTQLIAYLRTLRAPRGPALERRTIELVNGQKLNGLVLNETSTDLQFRTDDDRIHLLRPIEGKFREVTSQSDWTTYDGTTAGNRYSQLNQITPQNISKVAPRWVFTLEGGTAHGETTPLVVQGIMYVTAGNECWALDAGAGRQIWHYQRPLTKGLIGNSAEGINRGVAWAGDRVFMATDNAHMIALNRFTGALLWETEMADWRQNYNSTSAPLIVDNLVISGSAGGEEGTRGFIAAYDPNDGKEVWRFWTVPHPGEPGSETWGTGETLEHGGGTAWLTGSYDPKLDTLYWTTGNPGPDFDGEARPGDNLYTSSILALDPHTGKLKWYYQVTPHDLYDRDATQPIALIDRDWHGSPRKLLVQASRNGFYYVLDRETGKLLLGTPWEKNINWAKELDASGKPILLPVPAGPTPNSKRVCPDISGATSWFSTTYDPATSYYILQSFDTCGVFTPEPGQEWQAGHKYLGGTISGGGQLSHDTLRALDVTTGKVVWELPQIGHRTSWSGTLGLATGVLFFGGDGGMFTAVNMATGKPVWQFQTSAEIKSSPMTYVFDGKQYVAINAGHNIIVFGLPQN